MLSTYWGQLKYGNGPTIFALTLSMAIMQCACDNIDMEELTQQNK